MSGEDFPLAQILTKALKKDDKVNRTIKYGNDLPYNSVITLINTVCKILIK